MVETLAKLDRAFDELRYDEMADAIYHFVWGTFCDWYVELVKGEFHEETKAVAAWAFDQILVMLHPLMPFITEELWHAMPRGDDKRPYDLILAKWPEPEAQVDPHAKREIEWLIGTVSEFRSLRAEFSIPYSTKLTPRLVERNEKAPVRLERYVGQIIRLIGARTIMLSGRDKLLKSLKDNPALVWDDQGVDVSSEALQVIVGDEIWLLPTKGLIDVEAERARLSKAAAAAEKERDSLAQRLANPNFAERAKPEAVEKARADHDAKSAEAERLRAALDRLG